MSAMSDSLDELDTPGSLGEKAAIFHEGKGNVRTLSGGDHALIALHSPYQLPSAVHNRTATAAAALCRGNRKCRQGEEMQMNMVQNPFPDLFPSECLLPWTKNSATQQPAEESSMNFQARRVTLPAITPLCLQKRVIKVYSEDNSSRAVEVPSDITARDICQLFILKNHCIDDHSWTLIEHLAHLGIERIIEDHESVLEVQSNWGMDSDSRLYFRKNYAKYEFFKKPLDFFPESMVSISSEANGLMNHSQLIQTFLNSSTCPEIHGFLYSKEQGRKSWKKFYFVLRRSGLYFSNKGTSKEPRHLQFVAEFCDSDVYTLLSARKTHGAPTDYGFCIKPSKSSSARDLKLLCADVEQTRTCWITAMRFFKFGMQLYQNFIQPHQKQKSSPMRSISENSLVAMDFSGQRSRVIDNPSEALSVAVEEGLSWRRKSCHRLSHGSCSPSQSSLSNIAIHMAQPWFHSKLSRDEAHKLITQHGLIDGVFLLRDSQSNPKTFVLSLCHAQRIRHFQIVPVEDDGELFYSLDDGNTRFSDLLQLVEFYQLNRGVLPCKLKHHCARTTL
ncbi:growth factor receptor-bound protein 14 isoform X1 [Ictalurus punctatus]|nr:growth factor receptor-bound protein 14 isoform X1 [Ictalurus punctatus]XP_017325803.1 growth factor receptor-bound protein 14 isoform X1 [Ictalurus punctatus]XP_017325804.1 growth factor receptor-bound protein 14 isoform X1 [Ictalurus punctatus]